MPIVSHLDVIFCPRVFLFRCMQMPPKLSWRDQECFLEQGRVVAAHDSNLSLSVWYPLLKLVASSHPGELCCMGCVQGEGKDGTM